MSEYMDRVLPIVGEHFVEKNIAFVGTSHMEPLVDACVRVGANIVEVARAEEYGNEGDGFWYRGYISLYDKLFDDGLLQRNTHERRWYNSAAFGSVRVIKNRGPEDVDIDLVVGFGLFGSIRAITLGVAHNCAVVWGHLGGGFDIASYMKADAALGAREQAIGSILSHLERGRKQLNEYPLRVAGVLDVFGWMVKYHFLRDDEERRSDAMHTYVESGRSTCVRGDASNPYGIYWLHDPAQADWSFPDYKIGSTRKNYLRDKRIMVIGCGTSTLFLAHATQFFRNFTLIDYKPFSEYNAVRQYIGKADINGGLVKSHAMLDILSPMVGIARNGWTDNTNGDTRTMRYVSGDERAELFGIDAQVCTKEDMARILDENVAPDIVIVATGMTQDINHSICAVLRERGIPHIVPSALPSAVYHKLVVMDGNGESPCYSCIQGKAEVDRVGPQLSTEARELFYGGTQPATMFETLPSARALLNATIELLLPPVMQRSWFRDAMSKGKNCFLFSNDTQPNPNGFGGLYGIDRIGGMKVFGVDEVAGWPACRTCGRLHGAPCFEDELCLYCKEKPAAEGSDYCCPGHETLMKLDARRKTVDMPTLEDSGLL